MGLNMIPGDDIPGWTTANELSWLYETAKTMETIVEVGSWVGRSATALASGCEGMVYCVDHFKGSSEHQDTIKGGFNPKEEFIKNMDGLSSRITLLEMDSIEAAKLFDDKSVDMVFIDGAHEFDHVLSDLGAWVPKARRIICGHDYDYPSVKLALEHYFGDFTLMIHERIWIKEL
jgi:hypothetical protein